jgi:hypothetical protein
MNGFLRDVTGNRRFWTVKKLAQAISIVELDEDTVADLAEVLVLVEKARSWFLDMTLRRTLNVSKTPQGADDLEGSSRISGEALPENWYWLEFFDLKHYLRTTGKQTSCRRSKAETVSNLEIWCECFGKLKEDIKPSDSYAIAAIMLRIDGWERLNGRISVPGYGQQRAYRRKG